MQLREVERVERVPEREHHVVGDVDDVRDRAHPRGEQARLEPDRRLPERHVAEEPADVARAALEVLDRDVDGLLCGLLGILAGHCRQLEAVERGHLAGDPVDREQVRPVAGRLDEQHVVDERQDVPKRRPRLGLGQHHDPRVVGAELDLVLGEDHPVGELAAHLPLFELQAARELRARERDGDGGARAEVPGPADNLSRLALPHVDDAELQPVGVRVLCCLEYAPDAEQAEVPVLVGHAAALDPLDLGGRDRQALGQLRERHVERDVLAQPGDRDPQNCVRTRRSASHNARMSGKSSFSCATRSIPQPNANPDHSSGSTPTFSNTRGSTTPEPPISSQPE